MKKALWWHFFDGNAVVVDGVTLGIVLPREEFSPRAGVEDGWCWMTTKSSVSPSRVTLHAFLGAKILLVLGASPAIVSTLQVVMPGNCPESRLEFSTVISGDSNNRPADNLPLPRAFAPQQTPQQTKS